MARIVNLTTTNLITRFFQSLLSNNNFDDLIFIQITTSLIIHQSKANAIYHR